MAGPTDITKSGTPSLASVGLDPGSQKLPPLACGEDIAAGDACYIKSDGLIYKSTGAAATAPAKVRGFAPQKAYAGEVLTLVYNCVFNYGASLTPGADYYLSGATAGAIADGASTGGTAPIAFAIDTTRIHVLQSNY